jgi:ABC-type multidrug transport system fused ATPase/permease subunit
VALGVAAAEGAQAVTSEARAVASDGLDLGKLARIYRVFGRHYARQWRLVSLAFAGMFLHIGTGLLAPWPVAWIIDHVLEGEPLPVALGFLETWAAGDRARLLAPLAASVVLITLVNATAAYLHRYFAEAAGQSIVADIRARVFAHLQRLSLSFQSSWQSGDVVLRMTDDIRDLKTVLVEFPLKALQWSAWVIGVTAFLAWKDWRLAGLAWLLVPVLVAFTVRFGAGVRKASKTKRQKESDVASIVSENVLAMSLIQAYGREGTEKDRFDVGNTASLEAETSAIRLSKLFKRVADILVAIGMALVFYLACMLVLNQVLAVGILVVFDHYLKKLYSPVQKFALEAVDLTRGQVSGERILELVENDMVVDDPAGALPAPRFEGRVELRDVSFGYGRGPDVLSRLRFAAEPGETIALVGASGAGKSTLISLLLRFYDPRQGQVLFDGQDIRSFSLRSLREQITIVFQEPMLLRKTIRENIAFGRPGASEEEILRAARLAEVHEFASQLERGYDTLVLERGGNLSGGQKQRISIARAILRDTPILILDEPATGLDARTEKQVREALDHLMAGRTTFVIAHNFGTLRHADRILVLEAGEVAQEGTHEQLMRMSPRYRRLYEMQFGKQPGALEGQAPGRLAAAEA